MKKYLLLYAVLTTALLYAGYRRYRSETGRLAQNQSALTAEVEHFRTRLGEEAAAAQVLRLRCGEFAQLREADARRIRALGIKIRRLEAASTTVAATSVAFRAPLRDTLLRRGDTALIRPRIPAASVPVLTAGSLRTADSVRLFRWRDAWVTVEGIIADDSVACRVESVDTLRQIVHRIPRRFLFIRWGTKALRQQITSSNPHTRIVYTQYVKIER